MTHADRYPNLTETVNDDGDYEIFRMHADCTVSDEVAMRTNHSIAMVALGKECANGDDDACDWAFSRRSTIIPMGLSTCIVIRQDAPERILTLADDLLEAARNHVILDELLYYILLDIEAEGLWKGGHAATISNALTAQDIDEAEPDDIDDARTAYEDETRDTWLVAIKSDEPHDWAERFATWYANTWLKS